MREFIPAGYLICEDNGGPGPREDTGANPICPKEQTLLRRDRIGVFWTAAIPDSER